MSIVLYIYLLGVLIFGAEMLYKLSTGYLEEIFNIPECEFLQLQYGTVVFNIGLTMLLFLMVAFWPIIKISGLFLKGGDK